MMDHRDRAEGWKHAKITGHKNEEIVCELINEDEDIQKRILIAAHKYDRIFVHATCGGLNESNVPSIFGDTTKSKTDIYVKLDNGETINISLKKEKGGQVYLIGPRRFISGFEKQYGIKIPNDVQRAIGLFWGCEDDVIDIVARYSTTYKDYETRKHRLVAETLQEYDIELSDSLIEWFSNNIANLFDFCFSKGLAANKKDWAHLVWYRNEISEDGEDVDTILNINDLKNKLTNSSEFGNKTGGSTIQLPFGMVQWHSPTKKIPGDMQFHHSYEKIMEAIEEFEEANKKR